MTRITRMRVSKQVFVGVVAVAVFAVHAAAVEFVVTLDPRAAAQPVSGRLYVFLSQGSGREPRFGPNWFHPEPFFRIDVNDFRSGTSQTIGDPAAAFPEKLSRIPPGKYRAQAVLANNFYSCE